MLFYLMKYLKEHVPDMTVVFYEIMPNDTLTRAIHLLTIGEPSQYEAVVGARKRLSSSF